MLQLHRNSTYKNKLAQEERKAICSLKKKPSDGNTITTIAYKRPVP
jgi:hypothetical protein